MLKMLKTQPEMKTIYHSTTAFELTLDAEDNEKSTWKYNSITFKRY